jgi:hypothetical protein
MSSMASGQAPSGSSARQKSLTTAASFVEIDHRCSPGNVTRMTWRVLNTDREEPYALVETGTGAVPIVTDHQIGLRRADLQAR